MRASRSSDRRRLRSAHSFARRRTSGQRSSARPARALTEEHAGVNAAMADRPARPDVTGVEHWTTKDGVRLFLWEKFVDSPANKPALLFVHGSSMASQPTFDLSVPGRPDSSVMDWCARRGFVCWSVDMEGYGRSDKSRDIFCDIANGADDLAAATAYMREAR